MKSHTAVWSVPDAGVCWGHTHAAYDTGNYQGILMTSQEVAWTQTIKGKKGYSILK